MQKRMKINRIRDLRSAVIIGFILSFIAIGYGLTIDEDYKELKSSCTASASANIVDIEQKTVRRRHEIGSHEEYRGVYAFKTEDDTEYHAYGGWSESKDEKRSVTVMYDPKHPQTNYIKGNLNRGYLGYIVGGMFLVMTVFMIVRIKKLGGTVIPEMKDVPFGKREDDFYDDEDDLRR